MATSAGCIKQAQLRWTCSLIKGVFFVKCIWSYYDLGLICIYQIQGTAISLDDRVCIYEQFLS